MSLPDSLPDGPFIFVSYARVDSDFVQPEIERLEKLGYMTWYDKEGLEPGRPWDEAIRQAVDACACFIVFITHDSINSRNVRKEIARALRRGKPFISIHWQNVEIPLCYRKRILEKQALERYAQFKHEYEKSLERALSPYRRPGFGPPRLPPPDTGPDALPKIVFFMLGLLAVLTLLFAVVLVVFSYVSPAVPGNLRLSRLVGWLSGLIFTVIACGLGATAFAVYRVYLRRK
jgi:hypothetical protein